MKDTIEWHDLEKDKTIPLTYLLIMDADNNVYPAIFDWVHDTFNKPDYIGWTPITDARYWAAIPGKGGQIE